MVSAAADASRFSQGLIISLLGYRLHRLRLVSAIVSAKWHSRWKSRQGLGGSRQRRRESLEPHWAMLNLSLLNLDRVEPGHYSPQPCFARSALKQRVCRRRQLAN
jgi:hypothetical protein